VDSGQGALLGGWRMEDTRLVQAVRTDGERDFLLQGKGRTQAVP
jgi:hypothetical protein